MTIPISQLVDSIEPQRTILLFGAGSSIPSNAPSVSTVISRLSGHFKIPADGFSLSEISGIIETRFSRHDLITYFRTFFENLRPNGGLMNLPIFDWKGIYTTNYDQLIEKAYKDRDRQLFVYHSNYDFRPDVPVASTRLYKLHGTIQHDVIDGHNSRLIITDNDYDETLPYREALYDRLKSDLSNSSLIIIGHSLADTHIKDIITRAAEINASLNAGGQIFLLLYTSDENRALLYEKRGIRVAFGGIDEFFALLAKKATLQPSTIPNGSTILDRFYHLRPSTHDVAQQLDTVSANPSAVFNGWPATYADIASGLTFDRNIAQEIHAFLLEEGNCCAILLGASGVGKTTAARQVGLLLHRAGHHVWEHQSDHALSAQHWLTVASHLRNESKIGFLIIDEAHSQLGELNILIDGLAASDNNHLRILAVSSRHTWVHRIKTPNMFRYGKEYSLSILSNDEIERLLSLVETKSDLRKLVENTFSGFSKTERKRRLKDRCEADMFVCMKNIFASEAYDDIILREFGSLSTDDQDIYRYVSAMEASGIRVHRQLIIRLLGINASAIAAVLSRLTDIIHEYDVDEPAGIFGWKTRHGIIASIIAKAKFHNKDHVIDLFDRVIGCISPTFPIEVRTINELCNIDTGLPRIADKEIQNRLLRKMMSIAPGERVPRHRLIRNLISMGQYEKAETEIRLFEKDFRSDSPVFRYKILLLIARATKGPGLMEQDRLAIMEDAYNLASLGVSKYPQNRHIISALAELGIEYYKRTKNFQYYDEAISLLHEAEQSTGDPDISRLIAKLERRMAGQFDAADIAIDDA